ncbi:hypothetical protein FOA52_003631 [Chlamydomonas sp. UWO 241]|nr:hypothetical protein FOA52_003631 [Chlamydomonas sp. UWO 241]
MIRCPMRQMRSLSQRDGHSATTSAACTSSAQSTACGDASSGSEALVRAATQYYQDVWSRGKVTLLNELMSEEHEQHDMIWQPGRVGSGRRAMKRGVLAYRAAYPDLVFAVLAASFCPPPTAQQQQQQQQQGGAGVGDDGAPAPSAGVGAAAGASRGSVFVRWRATGTNLGPIREQAPTGARVDFEGVAHLEFDHDGKIARSFIFRQAPADEARYFTGGAGGQPVAGKPT